MRSSPLVLALVFVAATLLLLGGRAAQAHEAAPPAPLTSAPTSEPLVVTAADPAAAAPAGGPALLLATTVGLDPNCLGATEAITVPAGTQVTFCYQVTNLTGYTLTAHTLRDYFGENLLNELSLALPNGASTSYKRAVTPPGSVTNLATWSVTQPITGYTAVNLNCADYPTLSGGQALHLDDDEAVNLTLPFHVQFYDRYTDRLRVSNNGAVLFDEPNAGIGFTNNPLPTAGLPHGLAAFWDDFDAQTGEVYAGLATVSGVSVYVVEYRSRSVFGGGPTNPGSFAVMLFAPGQSYDGHVAVCYKDTNFDGSPEGTDGTVNDFGGLATLGVNHNGGAATQYSFNTPNVALTGTFGLLYTPLGGAHAAFAASDSARVNVITILNLPLVLR